MYVKDLFIVLSTALILTAPFPYIRDVVRGKTKPKIVTWSNWALLAVIAASASLSDHQYAAAIMSYSTAFLCLSIAFLAWHNGSRQLEKLDMFCQVGIVSALILWWIFNSPAIAIISVILIDSIALLPTLKHAWRRPNEETPLLFLMTAVAALFTVLAAASSTITSLAMPIYLLVADLATAGIIIGRRRVLTK